MAVIKHIFEVKAPVTKVYEAISTVYGIRSWWTTDTTGIPEKGGELRFGFGDGAYTDVKVVETQKNKKIAWQCTGSTFSRGKEWVGTTITFNLSTEEGNETLVRFEHGGWKDETEFYGICTYHWGVFMTSLKALCETGKGNPEIIERA